MVSPERPVSIPFEDSREVITTSTEIRDITHLARTCLESASQYDMAVVSDRSVYLGIPHFNSRRTMDIGLAFKDAAFSKLDIELPHKDPDVRIHIKAYASDIPGRTISLTEWASPHHTDELQFFADDSHAIASSRNRGTINPLVSQTEVANWLYAQAGLDAEENNRRTREEDDPVRNAAMLLASRAQRQLRIRQIALPLGVDVALHGQIVDGYDANNRFTPVTQYTTWVNQTHEIDGHEVKERLLVEFSPNDPWIETSFSPLTKVKVMLETQNPAFDIQQAAIIQAQTYENAGTVALLSKVKRRLDIFEEASR